MDKLSKFGVCDVSDALVKFGVKDGGFIPNLTMQSAVNTTILGTAYTVLYASKADPRPEITKSYIDQLPANCVLVMGLPLELQTSQAPYTKVNNAMYGGLMSTRAKYLKAQGSVILGRIRDLDEHRDLQYPVFSYGTGSTAPTPYLKVVGINVPIEVKVQGMDGDQVLVVNPNDIVMGDKNGVVKFSPDRLLEIAEYVPKRVAADANVAKDIKNGREAKEAQKYWRLKI